MKLYQHWCMVIFKTTSTVIFHAPQNREQHSNSSKEHHYAQRQCRHVPLFGALLIESGRSPFSSICRPLNQSKIPSRRTLPIKIRMKMLGGIGETMSNIEKLLLSATDDFSLEINIRLSLNLLLLIA